MKKAGIIGYGRFGRVLADLLSKKYAVRVYDIEKVADDERIEICSLDEVLECTIVFIAVPIRSCSSGVISIVRIDCDSKISFTSLFLLYTSLTGQMVAFNSRKGE